MKTNKLTYFILGFAGLIFGLGIFNVIDGAFFSKNTWQNTCGLFQLLYASSLIMFWPSKTNA